MAEKLNSDVGFSNNCCIVYIFPWFEAQRQLQKAVFGSLFKDRHTDVRTGRRIVVVPLRNPVRNFVVVVVAVVVDAGTIVCLL